MPRPAFIIAAILLAIGSVEAIAWWWMHPSTSNQDGPILAYRPQGTANPTPANPQSTSSSTDHRSPITDHSLTTITPLPEIYRQAAPLLRCSSGEVFQVTRGDRISLHLAWFEWNESDTGSVLEAFRHLPEICMGSVGYKLVSKEKPIPYQVGDQTILFDHTVFREPSDDLGPLVASPRIHAFRAVWVSGTSDADARSGLKGRGFDQLRTIRLNSALSRYRPSHARVIQGAIRGALTADAAWAAFEETMLRHLTLVKP